MWRLKQSLQRNFLVLFISFFCVLITQSGIGISTYADREVPEASCSCTPSTCDCDSACCSTSTVSQSQAAHSETQLTSTSCKTQMFHMEMVLLMVKGILQSPTYAYSPQLSVSPNEHSVSSSYINPTYTIFHPPSHLS